MGLVQGAAFALTRSEGQSRSAQSQFAGLQFTEPMVIRRCKVFEVGDYPDKEFSLNEEEARRAVAEFAPADIDIEHVPSVLDGKLGSLLSLVLEPDGKTLSGDVAIPEWLDRVAKDVPVELSAAWDRATKRLQKLALVLKGRVTGTALMSAYAEFIGSRNNTQDQKDLQTIHDTAVRMSNQALCPSGQAKMSGGPTVKLKDILGLLQRSGTTDPEADISVDELLKGQQQQPAALPTGQQGNSIPNNLAELDEATKARVLEFLSGKTPNGGTTAPLTQPQYGSGTVPAAVSGGVQFSAQETELKALRERQTAQDNELASFRERAFKAEAEAFYQVLFSASKITPGEKDSFVVDFVTRAIDDHKHGEVQFSDGTRKGRVQMLKDQWSAKGALPWGQELVPVNGATVLPTQMGNANFGQPQVGVSKALVDSSVEAARKFAEKANKGRNGATAAHN